MRKKYTFVLFGLFCIGWLTAMAALLLHGSTIAILDPKGLIGQKERNLIIVALLLSLIVVIPVYAMTFLFAWKYRESNTSAKYTPDWDHNVVAETTWWLIPSILILILSIMTWNSSHQLDPFRPLASKAKPMTIQVVALDWKWLFIYPQQHVASVNFVQFPERVPIDFEITADAPMNSFWVPQLGGQIYAMPGMSTHLHLIASEAGSFRGSSANISGRGFSGMKFIAQSSSEADFTNWIRSVKQSPDHLNLSTYNSLAQPSENNPVAYYSSSSAGLYDSIIEKFMVPGVQQVDTP